MVHPFLRTGSEVSFPRRRESMSGQEWIPDQVRNDKIHGHNGCERFRDPIMNESLSLIFPGQGFQAGPLPLSA